MLLFSIAFSIAKMITIILVIFQFLSILVTRQANAQLLRLAKNLNAYLREVLEFQTFNTERHPFPFSPWPDEVPGGDVWLEDYDLDDDDYDDDHVEVREIKPKAVKKPTKPKAKTSASKKKAKPTPDDDEESAPTDDDS
jgi:hypothetical protein